MPSRRPSGPRRWGSKRPGIVTWETPHQPWGFCRKLRTCLGKKNKLGDSSNNPCQTRQKSNNKNKSQSKNNWKLTATEIRRASKRLEKQDPNDKPDKNSNICHNKIQAAKKTNTAATSTYYYRNQTASRRGTNLHTPPMNNEQEKAAKGQTNEEHKHNSNAINVFNTVWYPYSGQTMVSKCTQLWLAANQLG